MPKYTVQKNIIQRVRTKKHREMDRSTATGYHLCGAILDILGNIAFLSSLHYPIRQSSSCLSSDSWCRFEIYGLIKVRFGYLCNQKPWLYFCDTGHFYLISTECKETEIVTFTDFFSAFTPSSLIFSCQGVL